MNLPRDAVVGFVLATLDFVVSTIRSRVRKLDEAPDEVARRRWAVVDMKTDRERHLSVREEIGP